MPSKPHSFHIDEWREDRQRNMASPTKYRGYVITYDPPPIPIRSCDWQYAADDYDGAPDSNDNRCGTAASYDDCIDAIDELEDQ